MSTKKTVGLLYGFLKVVEHCEHTGARVLIEKNEYCKTGMNRSCDERAGESIETHLERLRKDCSNSDKFPTFRDHQKAGHIHNDKQIL